MRGMARYSLRINGKAHEVEADPADSLLSILRYDVGLTGSKYGCGEGQCGACTVLIDGAATKSCVTTVGSVANRAITTIEGLSDGKRLHPVQDAFLDAEAFQCGYCTPGMIMAAAGLLRTNPNPTEADIARVLDRNVCRCGTFPRIVKAIKLAAERMKGTSTIGARRPPSRASGPRARSGAASRRSRSREFRTTGGGGR
jgi:aerobic-type carbon monoxide dehydrogenase small subunit (CoxS/CutS family)